jgi:hypothetical protein
MATAAARTDGERALRLYGVLREATGVVRTTPNQGGDLLNRLEDEANAARTVVVAAQRDA